MRLRAVVLRVLVVVVFVPGALACFGGVVLFAGRNGDGLLDDTWAYLGGGTVEGVPVVSQVSCVGRTHGGGSRSLQLRDWACVIDLAPPQRPAAVPAPGMTTQEVMEENFRRLAELRRPDRGSSRLNRVLASDRTGDIPTLRRLSAAGEPPRYGIVWGVGELGGRWLHAAFSSALLIGAGAMLLFVSWFVWRRSAALTNPRRG
jgi:hypothetical protein